MASKNPAVIEKRREYTRKWRLRNKEHRAKYDKAYYAKNFRKKLARDKDYRRRPEVKARKKFRAETDANLRLKLNGRARLYRALKSQGARKNCPFAKLVGCDPSFLRGYLEARLAEGMTWGNYGRHPGWHVDHHIPCAEFDLRDPDQQRQCFHYSNLRPIWAADNFRKSRKMPSAHQAELI